MEHPKKLLARYDLHPKKRFGQNFLTPGPWLDDLARTVPLSKDDTVIEIGPGLGALTAALAQRAGRVITIEIDPQMVHILREEVLPAHSNIELIHADALEVSLEEILPTTGTTWFFGNLPYSVSTPLMRWAFGARGRVEGAVFMLQREVADRIAAPPGNKQYGSLSVQTQLRADVKRVMKLRPGCFYPAPKIDSAVILARFRRELRAPVESESLFDEVVFAAFGQRRKQLANSLKGSKLTISDSVESVLKSVQIDGTRRAETLSVEEFARLANAVYDVTG